MQTKYKLIDSSMVKEDPYPFVMIDDFMDAELINNIEKEFFSRMDRNIDDRMFGRRRIMKAVYESNPIKYGQSLNNFMDIVRSDEFMMNMINPFKQHVLNYLGIEDNNFDLEKLCKEDYYLDYDISIGEDGYSREVHRDTNGRLIVFLFSFNDSKHDGGEICLYRAKEGCNKAQQYPTNVEKAVMVNHRKNRALMFLSNDVSYHSVNEITNCEIPRKFIYAAITRKRR
jgi:hypothetical protein